MNWDGCEVKSRGREERITSLSTKGRLAGSRKFITGNNHIKAINLEALNNGLGSEEISSKIFLFFDSPIFLAIIEYY